MLVHGGGIQNVRINVTFGRNYQAQIQGRMLLTFEEVDFQNGMHLNYASKLRIPMLLCIKCDFSLPRQYKLILEKLTEPCFIIINVALISKFYTQFQ